MREAIRAILAGAVELHLSDVSDVDVLQKARIIEEFVVGQQIRKIRDG